MLGQPVNLGLLELQVLQGLKGLMDKRVVLDRRAVGGLMATQGPRVNQAPQGMLDCREVLGHQEWPEGQVPLDYQAIQEGLVPLDLQDLLDN